MFVNFIDNVSDFFSRPLKGAIIDLLSRTEQLHLEVSRARVIFGKGFFVCNVTVNTVFREQDRIVGRVTLSRRQNQLVTINVVNATRMGNIVANDPYKAPKMMRRHTFTQWPLSGLIVGITEQKIFPAGLEWLPVPYYH